MSNTNEKNPPRVLVLGGIRYVDIEYAHDLKNKFELHTLTASTRKELQEELRLAISNHGRIDALVLTADTPPYTPFDEALLKPLLPHCRLIASAWAGYEDFDVGWMTSQKIWFCNTVDAVAEATADMAMWLILSVVRNTRAAEEAARAGAWYHGLVPTRGTTGMTLGILGMGSIGRHLASKAKAFNMRVKYYNRRRLTSAVEEQLGAAYCSSLAELLREADVLSINCPLTDTTTNLISTEEFATMKHGSFLINTARGAVVNEEALIAALESGKIERAGLDVFRNEPDINDYFKKSDRVVIQPHMGGWTEEAMKRAEVECFENVKAVFTTGNPVAPVNSL